MPDRLCKEAIALSLPSPQTNPRREQLSRPCLSQRSIGFDSTAMPTHSLAIVLVAVACLLCSNKNAGANADAEEEKPKAIGALQDSHQSSATHEPVTPVSKYNQPILSHSDTKKTDPSFSEQEARLVVVDTSNYGEWCIAKPSTDADQLQRNLNYVCIESPNAVNCENTEPGGVCYTPGNKVSEASFNMNLYFQKLSCIASACFFNNSGLVVSQDPSWGNCNYPSY